MGKIAQESTLQRLIELLLKKDGHVSVNNSTDIPLLAGNSFTGQWEDVSSVSSMTIAAKTDQDGTMVVQFSTDGTNIDSTLTHYYRLTHIEPPHRYTIARKYMRAVFTNTSASNQTYLRLQVLLDNQTNLNAPLDAVLSQDYDSTSVRPTDFKYEVALGRRQGAATWNKFGYNGDIDIGTEVVGAQGGTFTFLTTASTLTIVSSSTDDDGSPAGTGANSFVIYGIDANRVSQTEVVTMNGTTNVVTTSEWLGINRVSIYLAGSTYNNVGNITITDTTGGSVQAYVPAGKGTTQQLIFFTQADHNFLADWLILDAERFSGGSQPVVQFRGWVWSAVSNAKYEVLYSVVNLSTETEHQLTPSQPFVIGEKSVFWIEATTDQNNTVVSGRFSGIEVRDVDA